MNHFHKYSATNKKSLRTVTTKESTSRQRTYKRMNNTQIYK